MSHETPPQSVESKNQKRLEKIENILQGKQRNIVQASHYEWLQVVIEKLPNNDYKILIPYIDTGNEKRIDRTTGQNIGFRFSGECIIGSEGEIKEQKRINEYDWKDRSWPRVPDERLDEILESTEPIKIRETKEIDTDEARIKKLQKIEALRPTRWAYYGMTKHGFCKIQKAKEGYFEVSPDDGENPGFKFVITQNGKLVDVYEIFTDAHGGRGIKMGATSASISPTSEHEKILNETVQSFTDLNILNPNAKPVPTDADLDNLLKHFRQKFEKRDPDLN